MPTSTTIPGAGGGGKLPLPRMVVPELPEKLLKIDPEFEKWRQRLQNSFDDWTRKLQRAIEG